LASEAKKKSEKRGKKVRKKHFLNKNCIKKAAEAAF
jgi:hypothetical protein